MSGHTPGPWEVDDGDSPIFGVFASDGNAICYLAENALGSIGLRLADPANAQLIAAAPELLEALKAIRCIDCIDGILLRDSLLYDLDREGEDQPCRNCGIRRAAIAKAEGRA